MRGVKKLRPERRIRVIVIALWIGFSMFLIREEHEFLSPYTLHEGGRVVAIELNQYITDWADDSEAAPLNTDFVILQDHDPKKVKTPDEDPQSWLSGWSQGGWERFDAGYRVALTKAELMHAKVVLRPSAAGMLSDAVSTLNWCTRGGGRQASILLDPMGWIVPSMMRDLEDHLDRISELAIELQSHGRVWGVLVRSVIPSADQSTLAPCPLHAGELASDMILEKLGGLINACERVIVADPSDITRISAGEWGDA